MGAVPALRRPRPTATPATTGRWWTCRWAGGRPNWWCGCGSSSAAGAASSSRRATRRWPRGRTPPSGFSTAWRSGRRTGTCRPRARFLGVAEKTAEGWYYDYLERRQKAAGDGPEADPVAGHRRAVSKKRHRQFCCVLIDHTNGRVLDVLESREKAAVVAWLRRGRLRAAGGTEGGDVRHVGRLCRGGPGGVRRRGARHDRPLPRDEELPGAAQRGPAGDPETTAQGAGQGAEGQPMAVADQPAEPHARAAGGTGAAEGEVPGPGPAVRAPRGAAEDLRGRPVPAARVGHRLAEGLVRAGRALGLKALEKFNRTLENWMEKRPRVTMAR